MWAWVSDMCVQNPLGPPPMTFMWPCIIHADSSICPSHLTRTHPIPLCPFYRMERESDQLDLLGLYYLAGGAWCMEHSTAVTSAGGLKAPGHSSYSYSRKRFISSHCVWPDPQDLFQGKTGMHQVCQNRASCPPLAGTGQTCLSWRITAKCGGMRKSRQRIRLYQEILGRERRAGHPRRELLERDAPEKADTATPTGSTPPHKPQAASLSGSET